MVLFYKFIKSTGCALLSEHLRAAEPHVDLIKACCVSSPGSLGDLKTDPVV
jgi:hypothetical protein